MLKSGEVIADGNQNKVITSENLSNLYDFDLEVIKNDEFLEYAKVFDNLYGTTRTPVIDNLNKGKNVLFDIDWQGADQIKNKKLDFKLISFFILPPSREILFKRLSNRDMSRFDNLLNNISLLGGKIKKEINLKSSFLFFI